MDYPVARTPDSSGNGSRMRCDFIGALGFETVDLMGFSLGGFVAQDIAIEAPGLVRKLILTGTGPAGGTGISKRSGLYRFR